MRADYADYNEVMIVHLHRIWWKRTWVLGGNLENLLGQRCCWRCNIRFTFATIRRTLGWYWRGRRLKILVTASPSCLFIKEPLDSHGSMTGSIMWSCLHIVRREGSWFWHFSLGQFLCNTAGCGPRDANLSRFRIGCWFCLYIHMTFFRTSRSRTGRWSGRRWWFQIFISMKPIRDGQENVLYYNRQYMVYHLTRNKEREALFFVLQFGLVP